jgi:hypothetical protein
MGLKDRAKALEVGGASRIAGLEVRGKIFLLLQTSSETLLKRSDPQTKCLWSVALLQQFIKERG